MGSYVQLGEVRTWYEDDGGGEPLVLLHPGGADSRAFEGNLSGLADQFRVLRPDRRGHGRTPDVAGPSVRSDGHGHRAFEHVVGAGIPGRHAAGRRWVLSRCSVPTWWRLLFASGGSP